MGCDRIEWTAGVEIGTGVAATAAAINPISPKP